MKQWRRILAILFTLPGLFILAGSGEPAFAQDEHAGHTLSSDFGKVHFAWSALGNNNASRAIALMQDAADREDRTPH